MFSRLRKRHGAALPIAVVALAVAVAFAGVPAVAAPVANTSASFAQKLLRMVKGANKRAAVANKRSINAIKLARQGGQGPVGPQGPEGPKGDKGDNGSNGSDGSDGQDGKDGISVTSEEFEGIQGPCEDGGSKFTSASGTSYACNGAGSEGGGGLPATLPSEATLTGYWTAPLGASGAQFVALSYPVPLAAKLPTGGVHYVKASESATANCPGSAADPQALPGHLCVYAAGDGSPAATPLGPNFISFPEKTGAMLLFNIPAGATQVPRGTFAVTAP